MIWVEVCEMQLARVFGGCESTPLLVGWSDMGLNCY